MTTAQESTNGHRVSPPSCSFPGSKEETQSDNSTNNFNSIQLSPTPTTEPFPANAYHVPPQRFAPKAHAYRQDDFLDLPPETDPLPERCQFMFSDGRQCTMARSDIHPSLCTYHSDREEQLFGDPGGSFVTRKLDFPELFSASNDLTTAAGVNRALAQVFRLLAQRRISRQEAATFGHLAQLLLRTISLMRSSNEGYSQQEPVLAGRSSDIEPEPSAASPGATHSLPQHQLSPPREGITVEPTPGSSGASAQDLSQVTQNQQIGNLSRNSNRISTYVITEDKAVQNQHLHKTDSAAADRVPRTPVRCD